MTWYRGYRPTWLSVWKAFFWLNILAFCPTRSKACSRASKKHLLSLKMTLDIKIKKRKQVDLYG
nr:YwaF family protein [Brevibacillus laterosporus]